MPLKKGSSQKIISENIKTEMRMGVRGKKVSQTQAIAIAEAVAHRKPKKKKKGK